MMERIDCDRMFIAVIEAGSFRGAAVRLQTNSVHASKLVSRLESDLGVQLLKRAKRALALTEIGASYYKRIKSILNEFDTLNTSIKKTSGLASGKLRLFAEHSFGTAQLLPGLIDFAQLYPDIELDVKLTDRRVNLVDEGFDAGIRVGKLDDSSLIARKLCDVRIVVCASPSYIHAHGVPQDIDHLQEHACIIDTSFKDPYKWQFKGVRGTIGAARSVGGRLRFCDAAACLAAAKAGLGVTRLPSFIAGPSFRDGSLVPLFPDLEGAPLSLSVFYPTGRHLPLKMRALIDFLVTRYQGQPLWDCGWLTDEGDKMSESNPWMLPIWKENAPVYPGYHPESATLALPAHHAPTPEDQNND